jgi:hypothetical protein
VRFSDTITRLHDDGIRTFSNMPINQFFQTWQIKTSVLMHRRDYRNDAALDHNYVTAKI